MLSRSSAEITRETQDHVTDVFHKIIMKESEIKEGEGAGERAKWCGVKKRGRSKSGVGINQKTADIYHWD